MLSKLFLGISLIGAEWVLYLLVFVSVISLAVILERIRFYSAAGRGLKDFRMNIRRELAGAKWTEALRLAEGRAKTSEQQGSPDLESEMAFALLSRKVQGAAELSPDILGEVAQDAMMRARLDWERNLAVLATIGSNSPFVGLFGTVLGIIKAFHDLSQQVGTGAQTVTAGISEALVATAFGILVAIPAVIAFNLFQSKVKAAKTEAEALKSYIVGCLSRSGT